MTNRNELIDFILESVKDLENISEEESHKLLTELNLMSYEDLEKEADWYEELLMK
jgi:hypothetical protein